MAGLSLPGFPNSSPLLLSPSKPPVCVSVLQLFQALKRTKMTICVYGAINDNYALCLPGYKKINKLAKEQTGTDAKNRTLPMTAFKT